MILALTGGMGCGKSFVLSCFARRGWTTVETDALGRDLLARDEAVAAGIREAFGPSVFSADAAIDRAAVARRVFGDDGALAVLEGILHPRIRAEWERRVRECGGHAVVEIPLLFEKNLEKSFKISVCVSAGRQTQLLRLAQRGVDREDALLRMARQLSMQEKELRADYVISNNGDAAFTRTQVARLIEKIAL